MKKIILYTDGACSGNPGVGGWGAILEYNGIEKEMSGVCELTTNNQMELTAVIEGLKALKEPCEVDIYSDSAYVVNAFVEDWITSWQLNGWKNANKKEVNPSKVNSMAQMYTKKLEEMKAEAEQQEKTSTNNSAKAGSLASKANLVRDYNSRNNK